MEVFRLKITVRERERLRRKGRTKEHSWLNQHMAAHKSSLRGRPQRWARHELTKQRQVPRSHERRISARSVDFSPEFFSWRYRAADHLLRQRRGPASREQAHEHSPVSQSVLTRAAPIARRPTGPAKVPSHEYFTRATDCAPSQVDREELMAINDRKH